MLKQANIRRHADSTEKSLLFPYRSLHFNICLSKKKRTNGEPNEQRKENETKKEERKETKEERLRVMFHAFQTNRLSYPVRISDPSRDPTALLSFLREPRTAADGNYVLSEAQRFMNITGYILMSCSLAVFFFILISLLLMFPVWMQRFWRLCDGED